MRQRVQWLRVNDAHGRMVVRICFSAATGLCYTNVKILRKGTIGFTVGSWLLISISLFMGSGWVMDGAFKESDTTERLI